MSLQVFKRLTAFTTLLTFLSTQVIALPAIQMPGLVRGASEISVDALVSRLEIPETLGRVTERYEPKGAAATILHIQDAHTSLEAQRNIRDLLHHLKKQNALGVVFVEGGVGKLIGAKLRVFKKESWNREWADILLKQGVLSGSEYFLLDEAEQAARHPDFQSTQVYGVETAELYRKNLTAYRRVLGRKTQSEEFLDSLKTAILTAASSAFGTKLHKFFREWTIYQARSSELSRHLEVLKQYAASVLTLDFDKPEAQIEWPQLVRVVKLTTLEETLEPQAAAAEHKSLKEWLQQKKLSGPAVRAVRDFDLARGFQHRPQEGVRAILENFYQIASTQGFDFWHYPALSKLWGVFILREEIDAVKLFEEETRLTDLILDKLAVSEQEKNLVRAYKDYLLLARGLRLELTDRDYERVLERRTLLKPSVLAALLNTFNRYPQTSPMAQQASNLDEVYDAALLFYQDAKTRDQALFDNMMRRMQALKAGRAVLITGGFHSEGLRAKLKAKNLAYAQIEPRIRDLDNAVDYEKTMLLEGAQSPDSFTVAFAKALAAARPAFAGSDVAAFVNARNREAQVTVARNRAARTRVVREPADQQRSEVRSPLAPMTQALLYADAQAAGLNAEEFNILVLAAIKKFGIFQSAAEALNAKETTLINKLLAQKVLPAVTQAQLTAAAHQTIDPKAAAYLEAIFVFIRDIKTRAQISTAQLKYEYSVRVNPSVAAPALLTIETLYADAQAAQLSPEEFERIIFAGVKKFGIKGMGAQEELTADERTAVTKLLLFKKLMEASLKTERQSYLRAILGLIAVHHSLWLKDEYRRKMLAGTTPVAASEVPPAAMAPQADILPPAAPAAGAAELTSAVAGISAAEILAWLQSLVIAQPPASFYAQSPIQLAFNFFDKKLYLYWNQWVPLTEFPAQWAAAFAAKPFGFIYLSLAPEPAGRNLSVLAAGLVGLANEAPEALQDNLPAHGLFLTDAKPNTGNPDYLDLWIANKDTRRSEVRHAWADGESKILADLKADKTIDGLVQQILAEAKKLEEPWVQVHFTLQGKRFHTAKYNAMSAEPELGSDTILALVQKVSPAETTDALPQQYHVYRAQNTNTIEFELDDPATDAFTTYLYEHGLWAEATADPNTIYVSKRSTAKSPADFESLASSFGLRTKDVDEGGSAVWFSDPKGLIYAGLNKPQAVRRPDRIVQERFGVWEISDGEKTVALSNFGALPIRLDGVWQAKDGTEVRQESGLAVGGGSPFMSSNGRTGLFDEQGTFVPGAMLTHDGKTVNVMKSPLARIQDGKLLHGFTDKVEWHVESVTANSITFVIETDEIRMNVPGAQTLADIQGRIRYRQTYKIENGELVSILETTNLSDGDVFDPTSAKDYDVVLGGGYHPFRQTANPEQFAAQVARGEWTLQVSNASEVWSKDSVPLPLNAQPHFFSEPDYAGYDFSKPQTLKLGLELTLGGLTPDADGNVHIRLENTITGEKSDTFFTVESFPYLLLWFPEKGPAAGVFSVEPLFSIPNGRNMFLSGNLRVKPPVITPGQTHIATWRSVHTPGVHAEIRNAATPDQNPVEAPRAEVRTFDLNVAAVYRVSGTLPSAWPPAQTRAALRTIANGDVDLWVEWQAKAAEFLRGLASLRRSHQMTPATILSRLPQPAVRPFSQLQRSEVRTHAAASPYASMDDAALIKALEVFNQRADSSETQKLRNTFFVPAVRNVLHELAWNLLGEHFGARDLWTSLGKAAGDPEMARRYRYLPIPMLREIEGNELWERLTRNEEVVALLIREKARFDAFMQRETTYVSEHAPLLAEQPVVYFSAEYGIHSLAGYGGGLGILSGDHFRGAAGLGLNFVGLGLLYRKGYFRQSIAPDGSQLEDEAFQGIRKEDLPIQRVIDPATTEPMVLEISFPNRAAPVKAWVWEVYYGKARLLLLDTDIDGNPTEDRALSEKLYRSSSGSYPRLEQYDLLGVGGMMALEKLGIDPAVIHLNDCHPLMAAAQAIAQTMKALEETVSEPQMRFETALELIRARGVFTTHTPIPAGNELFEINIIRPFLEQIFNRDDYAVNRLLSLGILNGRFNVAAFLQKITGQHNGVSALHGEVSRRMWKPLYPGTPENEVPITGIVNSVHSGYREPTGGYWQQPAITALFQPVFEDSENQSVIETNDSAKLREKVNDPAWVDALPVADEDLWNVHTNLKKDLFEEIKRRYRARTDVAPDLLEYAGSFDAEALTIGFARRFIDYKRALLILDDLERLEAIAGKLEKPLQLIFAGKAHPKDLHAQGIIRELHQRIEKLRRTNKVKVLFVEEYDIELARHLEAGVDVWLNNPVKPLEASGTSGMKAGMNGVLNLSIADGWWEEGAEDGVNGWSFGAESDTRDDLSDREALYQTLEQRVIPVFNLTSGPANLRSDWIRMMKASILSTTYRFGMERMLSEYASNLYLPAAQAKMDLTAAEAQRLAGERLQNQKRVEQVFKSANRPTLKIERHPTDLVMAGEETVFYFVADLKGLQPEDVGIDLFYHDVRTGTERWIAASEAVSLGDGKYRFKASVAFSHKGHYEFGARLAPRDQISWPSLQELESAMIRVKGDHRINAVDRQLLAHRAASDQPAEGQMFYIRIPAQVPVQKVFWASDATKNGAAGHWEDQPVEMQRVDQTLWAVTLNPQQAPRGHYEFIFLAELADGRKIGLPGDYEQMPGANGRGVPNAKIDIHHGNPLYARDNAAAVLTQADQAARADKAQPLLKVLLEDLAPVSSVDPASVTGFRQAQVQFSLPALVASGDWDFYVHYGFQDEAQWSTVPMIKNTAADGRVQLSAQMEILPYKGQLAYKIVAAPRSVKVTNRPASQWGALALWAGGADKIFQEAAPEVSRVTTPLDEERLVLSLLRDHIRGRPKAIEVLEDPVKGTALMKKIKAFLDRKTDEEMGKPKAQRDYAAAPTSDLLMPAYAVRWDILDPQGGQGKILVALNAGKETAFDGEGKGRARLLGDGAKLILPPDAAWHTEPQRQFRLLDVQLENRQIPASVSQYTLGQMEKGEVGLGVRRIQFLRSAAVVEENSAALANLFTAAIHNQSVSGNLTAAESLMKIILNQPNYQELFKRMILSFPDQSTAAAQFGRKGLISVMTFLIRLMPAVLESADTRAVLQKWNPEVSEAMTRYLAGNISRFLSAPEKIQFHKTSDRNAIVFSRTYGARRVYFSNIFSIEGMTSHEHKKSILLMDLETLKREVDPAGALSFDHFLEETYSTTHTAEKIEEQGGFWIDIPVEDTPADRYGRAQRGLTFQDLELIAAKDLVSTLELKRPQPDGPLQVEAKVPVLKANIQKARFYLLWRKPGETWQALHLNETIHASGKYYEFSEPVQIPEAALAGPLLQFTLVAAPDGLDLEKTRDAKEWAGSVNWINVSGHYGVRAVQPFAHTQRPGELFVRSMNARPEVIEQAGVTTGGYDEFARTAIPALKASGVNALWMVGQYQESPASAALNAHYEVPAHPGRAASAFAFLDYTVDARFGAPGELDGDAAYERFAARLADEGIRSLMDMVPHVAMDSPLIGEHPDMFFTQTDPPHGAQSAAYFPYPDAAHPQFWVKHATDGGMPWTDTAVLNPLALSTWRFLEARLFKLARMTQGGGVRFDSLQVWHPDRLHQLWFPGLSRDEFYKQMNQIALYVFGRKPKKDGWLISLLIEEVKKAYPDFKIIGEVYHRQHREWQEAGVDITYAKYLWDWLLKNRDEDGRAMDGWAEFKDYILGRGKHRGATLEYLERSSHFLENHDERIRVLKILMERLARETGAGGNIDEAVAWSQLLMIALGTVPGNVMLYDGQAEGYVEAITSANWYPRGGIQEAAIPGLKEFYERFGQLIRQPIFRLGSRPQSIPLVHRGTAEAEPRNIFAFHRSYQDEHAVVVMNHSHQPATLTLDLSAAGIAADPLTLELPAWGTWVKVFKTETPADALDEMQTGWSPPKAIAGPAEETADVKRSEVRHAVRETLETLAGTANATLETAEHIRRASSKDWNDFEELFKEAAPQYAPVYANTQKQRRPGLNEKEAQFEREFVSFGADSPQAFEAAMRRALDAQNGSLHFNWIMPYQASLQPWLESFLGVIEKLSAAYGGRVSANLALVTADGDYQRAKDFFTAFEANGRIRRINPAAGHEAFAAVNDFLSAHDNALAIGLPQNLEKNVMANHRVRLVAISGLPLRKALPISSVLLFRTAQASEITAELLGKLPFLFPQGMLGYDSAAGRLMIMTLAERYLQDVSIARHLATMA